MADRANRDEDKAPLISKDNDTMDTDPYFAVRDGIQSQSEKIKSKYSKFQKLVQTIDTASDPEFKEVRRGLMKDVRSFEADLKALIDAVDTVEKDRRKFPMVKDADLAARKKFVGDMSAFIKDIKKGYESQSVRQKLDEDQNRTKRGNNNPDLNSRNSALDEENNRFVKDQKLRTKEMIADQDRNLAILGENVDRLGQTSRVINQELKEHNNLLSGLETDIDHASNRMTVVMEALQKLLKTKDGCQIWTIVILAIILILLVALVIWS